MRLEWASILTTCVDTHTQKGKRDRLQQARKRDKEEQENQICYA